MSDQCNPEWRDAAFSFYRYVPSLPLAIIFAALFCLTTLLHSVQLSRTKTWYLIPLVIGGFCEMIGYIGRAMNANEGAGCWTLGPYIMQSILILIGPAFMAASIYMILGRIIMVTEGERFSPIRLKWLTKIFVFGDVLSLLMQSSGGGLMAMEGSMKLGERIIIIGLFVQLAFFGCFVVISMLFHRRMLAKPTYAAGSPQVRWQLYLTTLYVTSSLILIRSIFRVVEYIGGNDGPMMSTEVWIYVFDAALMIIAFTWMNWFHPSEIGILLRGGRPSSHGLSLLKSGAANTEYTGAHSRNDSA